MYIKKNIDVVFILPITDSGVLLFKNRKSGYWELPAGPTRINESVLETAVRYCLEQTNLNLVTTDYLGDLNIVFENHVNEMTMGTVKGYVQDVSSFIDNSHFSEIVQFDENNPPSPFCSTCQMILNEYLTS
ncbi:MULTISPECIES: NUDIX domain-containing protein [unclassified Fusibacter]|uniref:NUDIX domain-containing protein n=1 Tax=unclassified Fusibacter TaxID=2624464 RepID=UPI001012AC4D|nr:MULTISPECIES: NUDIX domain-containing protein [unclassified Fusibacter]MCK8059493.1 NUDIX domain-containing protein [Fusibacter sp. A2]NPE21043.1 NUDIX domain-containing protein [Fusibacter sp. A1]RXV62317.1 hypothetical protein DWB64_04350 [Fusibacter sp. A1]